MLLANRLIWLAIAVGIAVGVLALTYLRFRLARPGGGWGEGAAALPSTALRAAAPCAYPTWRRTPRWGRTSSSWPPGTTSSTSTGCAGWGHHPRASGRDLFAQGRTSILFANMFMIGDLRLPAVPREVNLEDFELPDPTSHQVLVRLTRTLVSAGTEISSLLGRSASSGRWPVRPGYSSVGVVAAVGSAVTDLVGHSANGWR